MSTTYSTIDANEAVASVAYRCSEVAAIYPITPSSPMGESAETWTAVDRKNLWGTVPSIVEMESEAGAAGAVHGALQTGSLATTFTASQGLLLMIPNMYKIAGELIPCVFHIAARALAAQGLSIFGDHSDVMSCRSTGFAMLCGASTQEAPDMAAICHAATLESRVPFINFFDGFRTSHEVGKIADITDEHLRGLISQKRVDEFHARGLNPDAPVIRGTAQNPDVYFQGRETVNKFYNAVPGIVKDTMKKFGDLTGRYYDLVEYIGSPTATRVIIIMGSGAEACLETVEALKEDIGVLKVRLYRPFPAEDLVAALPTTVKKIAVLDRTKEPGSQGEPLLQDVIQALADAQINGTLPFPMPVVVGGRYGLGSKDFTPAMVKGVYDELAKDKPMTGFAVGIEDDVTGKSIAYDPSFSTEAPEVTRCLFYGLGSDGTVGANKDAIKIIGKHTDLYVQGYFEYDSKKSGSSTISHLRFGPHPIHSTYFIHSANFIALHQPSLLNILDFLKNAADGATFLMNTPVEPDKVWDSLPARMQQQILDKHIKMYCINAFKVAKATGMGGRINMIMQTCFFKLSGVIPAEEAIGYIKEAIKKTYGKKGEEVVAKNIAAVDATLENLHEVPLGTTITGHEIPPCVHGDAPDFVRNVLGRIIEGNGNDVKVSEMPVDGTFPSGTTQYEKRDLALEIPVWAPEKTETSKACIQCGKCTVVCPHAAIRAKMADPADLEGAPETFKSADASRMHKDWQGKKFIIQVSASDCTGCTLCSKVCPTNSLTMTPAAKALKPEAENWKFFEKLPDPERKVVDTAKVKDVQFLRPLFEFSGACAGCGETPYIKMLTQLFGNRLVVANATGCSSIYGGNLPTTPWSHGADGRGPAWANSLFEDNAEFGLGFRVSLDKKQQYATELLQAAAGKIGEQLVEDVLANPQKTEADVTRVRESVEAIKAACGDDPELAALKAQAGYLVRKSVWILGGDGWAYDIGYGGLDHVLASGRNVKVMVLDTEVYSNTGGQCSKSTPRSAVAKFASKGKDQVKKDIGYMAMTYGNIYVASVAFGSNDEHTLKTLLEAEAYDGPALIIAYSQCINHGINMANGLAHQKAAVDCGRWLLYNYNPDRIKEGKNPLTITSKAPKMDVREALLMENRFKLLAKANKANFDRLLDMETADIAHRWRLYQALAAIDYSGAKGE
ncbi:MAG: pyruvate:ferredoxin (flavodoxin) oxidoreductase [Akkermansia muciniphila]|nr:pyruvate:ferredoxin (flavodoxin) oxidoreductase [Akkermansia muciniphila]MDD6814640.1 pyruvate:ferredoxin (flavodoxin) oxidoreductase [Akkermansia muciniphila]